MKRIRKERMRGYGKAVDLSEMLVAARSHPNKYGSLTAP
jgi:hypothetical protein